jgi:hypothetical protein
MVEQMEYILRKQKEADRTNITRIKKVKTTTTKRNQKKPSSYSVMSGKYSPWITKENHA